MLQRAWKRSRALGNMVAVVFLGLLEIVRGVGGGRAQTLRFIFHAVCQQKSQKENFDAHKQFESLHPGLN